MPRYDNREEILADWLNGMTGEELAAKHGCSKTAGSSLAWKRGLKRSAKVKKLEQKKNSERVNAHLANHPPKTRHSHKKVADYAIEHGIAAAAAKFGYTDSTTRVIAKKHGWQAQPLDKAAILKEYLAGVSLGEIVEKHGCDRSYPATMAKRAGLKRRRVRTGKGK